MAFFPLSKLVIGPRSFSDTEISSLIIIGTAGAATAGRYNTLRKVNGSGGSGYQVTNGKTLTHEVDTFGQSSSTPGFSGILFYADNDSGFNSASTPTNAVYNFGDSTSSIGIGNWASTASYSFVTNFQVPSQKYSGFIPTVANMSCLSYCLET